MDIWKLYESLPPLERIAINFTVTGVLVMLVFRINKWAKKRDWVNYDSATREADRKQLLYTNLEDKGNNTLVAYIAYWRYLTLGLIYMAAIYVSINGAIFFYEELPPGFWKNWDKTTTVTLIIGVIAVAMCLITFNFFKSNYKKIQFEINSDSVRYLKSVSRGGTLLSNNYITVPLKDILSIELRPIPAGGGVIMAKTVTQTHSIILLLSTEEQLICYRRIGDAIMHR